MRRSMLGVALLAMAMVGPTVVRAQAGGDVHVTVTYKAKAAKVDATNDILVFLFDHPNVTGDSRPLGMQIVQKNGGTASFTGITAPEVYIIAVYDEKGNYDGQNGPPPAGTPVGRYSKDGKVAAPVKPGAAAKVKMTFTDARRWGQQ
jgi:hypothetical protein